MALINRLTRLIKADLHTVIEQLEEPIMLLKQSVREMEEALQEEQQQLKQLQHQLSKTTTHSQTIKSSISETNEELNTCFDAGNEALARLLIKRKLEAQQRQKALNSRESDIQQAIEQHQQRINEQQPRLEAMQQKLELLATEASQQISEPPSTNNWPATTITEADVEVALLREKQQRSQS